MSLLQAGSRAAHETRTRVKGGPIHPRGRFAARSRLGPTEIRRRLFHIGPGFLPFALWHIPHGHPFPLELQIIVVIITAGLGMLVYARYPSIKRGDEDRERLGACAGYAGSVLTMLLLFPAHAELAMTTLAVLAFGDGFATLGGMLLGGRRLLWNRDKTIAGMVCFFIFGTLMATLAYWGEAQRPLASHDLTGPWTTALACASATTVAAAVAESIRSRVNDNIRVGFVAAVTLICVHGSLVGWV